MAFLLARSKASLLVRFATKHVIQHKLLFNLLSALKLNSPLGVLSTQTQGASKAASEKTKTGESYVT